MCPLESLHSNLEPRTLQVDHLGKKLRMLPAIELDGWSSWNTDNAIMGTRCWTWSGVLFLPSWVSVLICPSSSLLDGILYSVSLYVRNMYIVLYFAGPYS